MNFIPQDLILKHNHVRLEPLTLAHETGLRQAVCDGELWRLPYTTAPAPHEVADYIQEAINTRYPFAVIDETNEKVVGTSSFYEINPQVPRVEIGYTWYAQSAQRTHINTTCKFLLMNYAFETLACHVIGWRTDIINTRSQAAIERLGAKKDGILRGFQLRKDGTIRDTVMYSLLASEWLESKSHLLKKLQK
ncbi:MAG: GNAT family protein [Alysiella sp.]|uniref:GNAT family N-acetyltransferase n=1 Tax=Alysiella sp. TaxID=1872483 RepID=UPI0026DCF603|nr:GNAT family protein [Alysiella sp.]MDO4433812.1 GNAT family protein [Alysiella sp.]